MTSKASAQDDEMTGVQHLGEFVGQLYLLLYFLPSFILAPLRTIGIALRAKNPEKQSFGKRYSDVRCVEADHMWAKKVVLEKQYFDKHPHSSADLVYVVTLYKCLGCDRPTIGKGLTFRDMIKHEKTA